MTAQFEYDRHGTQGYLGSIGFMGLAGKFRCFIQCVRGISVFACLILFMPIKPAHAYLDPGTGAMMLQLLLGGVAGALVVGKLYFAKIKSLIAGLFGHRAQVQGDKDENQTNNN